ncbi:Tyrosine-protein phosphatase YwqE [Geodia barretti]|uniref:Tyrosine-protein phosphatase YwqE n=1 Tax=Geodia barretti TaxID=519541 RepID=A0AA35RC51_GEOBA|nr:Tyrosine-protein phosphatase YwqE [Geodia barretti]
MPGVDDGPSTIEDSIAIARIATAGGTRVMLATPHRKDVTELSSVQHIRDLTAELQRRIHDENILLTLTLGMENHIDDALPEDAAAGKALTMNGSRYILVEMPFFGSIAEHDFVEGALLGIQAQGLTPVFAHPERIEAFQQQPELLERYINMGMLSQLTRGSLLGHWGEEIRQFSLDLLRQGMAHIISSDTHSPHPPRTRRTRRSPENRNRNRRLPESKGNGQRHAPRHPRRHEAYSPFPLNEGRLGWG